MATYLTPEGARKLQDELKHLLHSERPRVVQEVSEAAAQGDRSENAEYTRAMPRSSPASTARSITCGANARATC